MDYPRKLAIYHKGRESALNVLCQPVKGKPDLKSSDVTARCTQTASQSTWDTPCALPNLPTLTVAKLQRNWEVYYRIGDSASFGKCGFADSFKNIAGCIYNSVLIPERSLLHCSLHKQSNILPQTKIRQ